MFMYTAKRTVGLLLIIGVAVGCSNKGDEQVSIRDFDKRKGTESFISKHDMPQRLEFLLLETKGDTALLARPLQGFQKGRTGYDIQVIKHLYL